MENEGWIKLHRQFLKWEWHDSPETAHLFVVLLLLANHDNERWHGDTILRGQIVTSREKLAKQSGLTIQQVRTSLSRLEQTGEISKKTTNKFTVLTISNYDRYQVREEKVQPSNNQQSTSNQPSNNHQITTNKNDKNERIYITTQSWRCLSSVQKSVCGFNKDREAEMKRDIFQQEVESFVQEVGMNLQQVNAFVRYWTEHNPGSDKIRAEACDPFNTRERMISWMERERPSPTGRPQRQQNQDKLQTLIDERNKFQQAIYGSFDTIQADSTPDFQGE